MSGRECGATESAIEFAASNPTVAISEVARQFKVNRSTLNRALRRRGVAPRSHPSGSAHHTQRGL